MSLLAILILEKKKQKDCHGNEAKKGELVSQFLIGTHRNGHLATYLFY